MGPRRFRRGCSDSSRVRIGCGVKLQWGRDVSVADVAVQNAIEIVLSPLQWGRDVSVADVELGERRARRLGAGLQWGRDVSVADVDPRDMRKLGAELQASMGPRRFRRGCFMMMEQRRLRKDVLQWGRDVSVADVVR